MVEFNSCGVARAGIWRPVRSFLLGAVFLGLASGAVDAASTASPAVSDQHATATSATGAQASSDAIEHKSPPAAPLVVDGFRSAKFGMDEAALRSAIDKDFGIKGHAVRIGKNPAERTTTLMVSVPNLLAGGGTAEVSYVLGYKTRKLIQVGVAWSKATDRKMTPDELYANGEALKDHFLSAGYVPGSIKSGLVLRNGILLFRGEDKAGHATILLLQGNFVDHEGKKELRPASLALLYAADPDHPDIFKISAGQF